MKLVVAGLVGVMVLAAMSVGCGPGLSHRAKAPERTPDVFNAMDAELAQAMVGTTRVTSGETSSLPDSRLSVSSTTTPAGAVAAAAPTWGSSEESDRLPAEVAGIATASTPLPAATDGFDMHPYDTLYDLHPWE